MLALAITVEISVLSLAGCQQRRGKADGISISCRGSIATDGGSGGIRMALLAAASDTKLAALMAAIRQPRLSPEGGSSAALKKTISYLLKPIKISRKKNGVTSKKRSGQRGEKRKSATEIVSWAGVAADGSKSARRHPHRSAGGSEMAEEKRSARRWRSAPYSHADSSHRLCAPRLPLASLAQADF
jgi:hypothetical protein